MTDRVSDTRWVRGMFGASPFARDIRTSRSRFSTSADSKFADTTLGGNQAINPLPQFTRFADLKATGLFATPDIIDPALSGTAFEEDGDKGSYRMGRKYSDTIDDNAQYIHLRFGLPKWTGSVAYFANAYDRELGRLAKTGEYSSLLRSAGRAVGLYAMFMVVGPAIMIPLIITREVLKIALNKRTSRYYYLKPTQNLYLQALQSMLDTQLVHSRLVPMWDIIGKDRYNDVTEDTNMNKEAMEGMYDGLPDIWKSSGKFDVYRMMNRYQILANYQAKVLEAIYADSKDGDDYIKNVKAYVQLAKNTSQMKDAANGKNMNMYQLAQAYANNEMYQVSELEEKEQADAWLKIQDRLNTEDSITSAQVGAEQNISASTAAKSRSVSEDQTFSSFWRGIVGDIGTQLGSELKDGGQWVTFKVDAKPSLSDSFNNTSKTPEISGLVNGITSKARSIEVNASGGVTGIEFIDAVTKGVKNFIDGVGDSLNITGLAGLYGAANFEFPDVFDSSSTSVGSEPFTIQLRSPYGNDISLFQNITVPLMSILAGVLPLASGKQTYNPPLMCEAYCRGRQIVRMGYIESVSVTRGVGNTGWRPDGRMLACDITVNIKDMSKVMSMPILKDPSLIDDDNMFTDYMATLGAASLTELTYGLSKFFLNVNKFKQSWKSAAQTGRVSNNIGSWEVSRVLSGLTAGVAK